MHIVVYMKCYGHLKNKEPVWPNFVSEPGNVRQAHLVICIFQHFKSSKLKHILYSVESTGNLEFII